MLRFCFPLFPAGTCCMYQAFWTTRSTEKSQILFHNSMYFHVLLHLLMLFVLHESFVKWILFFFFLHDSALSLPSMLGPSWLLLLLLSYSALAMDPLLSLLKLSMSSPWYCEFQNGSCFIYPCLIHMINAVPGIR